MSRSAFLSSLPTLVTGNSATISGPAGKPRAEPGRRPRDGVPLLPEDWPGRRAHKLFISAHDALHGPADAFVRDIVLTRRSP